MGAHSMLANTVRRLENMFPGYFQTTTKRNHYVDFGYPETIKDDQLHQMFRRNGIATAAVEKTILKTWEDNPTTQEDENADELTKTEEQVAAKLKQLRFWQCLAEADRRSLVTGYSGLIFRLADNKTMKEPVGSLSSGLEGLVEIIPAWSTQLTVSEYVTDEMSEDYGKPKMFQFKESAVGKSNSQRQFDVHPDRVLVWSKDGTVDGNSLLEPGYNDLITIEKVIGAGGEGFWKNAKSSPVLSIDREADLAAMARSMGVPEDELSDKMDEQVADFQKGFDSLLMLQGMEAKTLGVTLPQPEEFVAGPLMSFAASIGMPLKILVGSQSGERASTEDAAEWSKTIKARRTNVVVPNIEAGIERLKGFGVLPDRDWTLAWSDLTESSMSEKIERADKMATINQKQAAAGSMEIVFTEDEVRETIGLKPLSDADAARTEPPEGEDDE